jgi:hypothetical protein
MSTLPTDHSDHTLEWFLSGFTAADLAEPLLSVDDDAPVSAALQVLARDLNGVIGVRRQGSMRGWYAQEDLAQAADLRGGQPFEATTVISETASLNEVVCLLKVHVRLFVRAFGQICGVITRNAVEKAPVRMWLFGLVTISEQRVTRLIDELLPEDSWQAHLSAGRLQKAQELQTLRHSRGQRPSLLDCLQFADKGQIVARDESLRRYTRFASRKEVERFVQDLQDLRNNLAHSQDISGDWEIIHDLAANLQHIVCGPVGTTADAAGQSKTEQP